MAKWKSDVAIQAGIDFTTTLTLMSLVSDVSTPIDLTNTLASVAMVAGDGNGDYTIADGTPNGRALTMTEKLAVTASASGDANHVVLSIGGVVHVVTTVTTQAIISGASIDFPSWVDKAADPE